MWKLIVLSILVYCFGFAIQLKTYRYELSILDPSTNLKEVDNFSKRRIVGGNRSSVEKFPYVVQIIANDMLRGGGTILTRVHILTCAHILVNKKSKVIKPGKVVVRSGTSIVNTGGYVTQAVRIAVHPDFNIKRYYHDIGMVVLAFTLEYSSRQYPATLAYIGFTVPDEALVTVMGWGMGLNRQDTVLQEVTMPIVSHEECARRFKSQRHTISENMLCAGVLDVGDKDTCQGDSGGPMVYNNIVVGVTSWGVDCGNPIYPGVYTRVSKYLLWLQHEAEKEDQVSLRTTDAAGLLKANDFFIFIVIFGNNMLF